MQSKSQKYNTETPFPGSFSEKLTFLEFKNNFFRDFSKIHLAIANVEDKRGARSRGV